MAWCWKLRRDSGNWGKRLMEETSLWRYDITDTSASLNTVKCHYNVAQYDMILRTSGWCTQNHIILGHVIKNIFRGIFLNENAWISLKISLKFVPKARINNIPALVQIMAWCRPGNKPLSEPMMVTLSTYICITQPQWVNGACHPDGYYWN